MPNPDLDPVPFPFPYSYPISVPRSASDPNFSRTKTPPLPSSNRSVASTSSSSLKKKNKHRARNSSKSSDLTEESLKEFNLRIDAQDEKKNSGYSPYYKGLTDSNLYLSRQREATGLSPGRESRTSMTSSFFRTVVFRFNRCFLSSKGKTGLNDDSEFDDAKKRDAPRHSSASASSNRSNKVVLMKSYGDSKDVKSKETAAEAKRSIEEKPLRERVLNPVAEEKSVRVVEEMRKELAVKEKEFFWANRYRPKVLKQFICNRNKAEELHQMVTEGQCTHLIFEGPPGAGKKTMIWAILREVFGPERLQKTDVCKEFELKGEAKASIKVNMKVSAHHVEVNLSDPELRGYEKHVIVALIKEMHNAVMNTQATQSNFLGDCQAIVLYEADKLSTDAQHYIRWLMERYESSTKIIFCCSDISKLQPIRTICRAIQLLPPSNDEIVEVLEFIAKEEAIELPHRLAVRIAENSKQNLRQAIRSFEASWQLNHQLKEDQVLITGWEEDIANIAKNIIREQSPNQLYIIRGKLRNLIEYNVSPEFIFSTLVYELKKHLDDQFQDKIDALYLKYSPDNGSIVDGEKSLALLRRQEDSGKMNQDPARKNVHHFMRIEEFTAKFMSFYQSCNKNKEDT